MSALDCSAIYEEGGEKEEEEEDFCLHFWLKMRSRVPYFGYGMPRNG